MEKAENKTWRVEILAALIVGGLTFLGNIMSPILQSCLITRQKKYQQKTIPESSLGESHIPKRVKYPENKKLFKSPQKQQNKPKFVRDSILYHIKNPYR